MLEVDGCEHNGKCSICNGEPWSLKQFDYSGYLIDDRAVLGGWLTSWQYATHTR